MIRVIARKNLVLLAMVALGASLTASPAVAKKKCGPLCKGPIADCRALYNPADCTQADKTEKKACKKAAKGARKACKPAIIALCKAQTDETVCSPSGAFIDPSLDTF